MRKLRLRDAEGLPGIRARMRMWEPQGRLGPTQPQACPLSLPLALRNTAPHLVRLGETVSQLSLGTGLDSWSLLSLSSTGKGARCALQAASWPLPGPSCAWNPSLCRLQLLIRSQFNDPFSGMSSPVWVRCPFLNHCCLHHPISERSVCLGTQGPGAPDIS